MKETKPLKKVGEAKKDSSKKVKSEKPKLEIKIENDSKKVKSEKPKLEKNNLLSTFTVNKKSLNELGSLARVIQNIIDSKTKEEKKEKPKSKKK